MVLVPGHFDFEIYWALRRDVRRGTFPRARLDAAVPLLARFPARRIPVYLLLREAHSLGTAFSVGDSFYVALARRVGGQLRTRDAPLAKACAGIVDVALI